MRALLLTLLSLTAEGAGPQHTWVRDGSNVRMILRAPHVRSVRFASSLDGFVVHDTSTHDGTEWEIRLPSQEPFRYFYLIDGKAWIPDCPCRELDDYGSEDCIYDPNL